MKKVLEFFKNRIVISIIGLIILSLLIWFVAPYIKFGNNNYAPFDGQVTRLLIIMVMLVLWGLNNLRISMQNARNNAVLVSDLQSNQSQAHNAVSEQRTEEMHTINERFTDALRTLQKLKFKGRGTRKALYELPWYIIIGPPGSGKTTALINSSLEFPLADKFGKEALHGVGGTRNCDWWFTNDAVLIDTAGRYTTQDSHKAIDSGAWDGFLDLLKRNRRRRPINGAIVAISLQELLTQTEDQRLAHAKTIRTRIDELMDKLEIRFPIYLMFTKTDLVSGFSEFFEDLGKEAREQVWGVSLPNAPEQGQSPDFDYLHDEFHKLIRRLYERVLARVHQERDLNRRGAIQGFPSQMENLKDLALNFVQQTFAKNRYQLQPYLRGVYFTSGTQDGTPIDRLISSVSANFGFDRSVVQSKVGMGKSFFLGELFRGVIFPESELVGSNRKYEMMIRWSQRGAYALLALLTILLITVWAGSFARNELYVREVQSYISEFNAERNRLSSSADDLRDMLPTLNALAKASNVYDQEAHPWLSGLGMYDGSLDAAADRAYASQLKRLVLPRLLRYLEARLRLGNQGGDLYDNFTTYMMFSKVEHMDKERVISWFDAFWDQELTGQATLRNELKVHTSALLNLELEPAELNKPLVSSVRTQLLQVPVSQRVYSRLRSKPEYANRINLLNEFGESARSSFVNNETVAQRLMLPYLFTKQAYDNIDLSPKSDLLAGLVREKWVLSDGENAHTDFAREDLDAISKDVKELYLTEYRSTWENIYSALEVRPFDDLRQANDVLLKFTDPVYSPLLAVLKVSVNNTSLTNQLFSNLLDDSKDGSKGKAAGMLAAQIKLNQVDTRFRELNLLLRESKDKPAPIGAAMQKIRQMQEFVNEMNISPDPGKMAFDVTKQRYQGGAGNAITSLLVQAKSMPDPLNRWMQTLANETWKVVLQSAHRNVDREWKNQVQAACNTALAGRYPFKSDSKSEVTMLDFTEFFKPGGTMDKFATEFVKPFVDGSGNIRGVDNHGLGLSAGTLAQISRAQTIKTVFFGTNPSVPSTSFQLRPYYMEKTNARFTLEVGDTRISYSHGPKFWSTLNWSGNGEKNRVRVLFEDLNDQQHSVTYDGPWAWFRLQDHSKLSRTPVANVYLATYSAPDGNHSGDEAVSRNATHTVRFEIKGQSANNPLNKDLLGGFRCADGI